MHVQEIYTGTRESHGNTGAGGAIPEGAPDMYALEYWRMDLKKYSEREAKYTSFRAGLYTMVFGQCTELLKDKFKVHPDFAGADQDCIALLKIIKRKPHTKKMSSTI